MLPTLFVEAQNLSQTVIVIDPGHGGMDPGAVWPFNGQPLHESGLVLDISLRIENLLAQHGIQVHLTRRTDVYVTLNNRAHFANNLNANLFVSVHANAFANTQSNGIETFFFNSGNQRATQSQSLAQSIQAQKVQTLGLRNRGVFSMPFRVLTQAQMPAVLSEIGFMSNPADMARIASEAGRADSAQAIYAGIMNFLGANASTNVSNVVNTPVATTPPAVDNNGTVTAFNLNVRTGPSTNHQIIGGLPRNASVSILETRDDWHRVQSGNITGWVSGDFVSLATLAPVVVVPATPAQEATGQSGIVIASVLNVRSGPSTNYGVLSTLRSGAVVNILETRNSWHRIPTGWVSGDFINQNGAAPQLPIVATPVVTPPPAAPASQTGTVTANVLNVRSGSSTAHGVVSTLNRGAVINILETRDGWHRMASGWVSGDFVSLEGNAPAPIPAPAPSNQQGTVTANFLNIRAGASTGHNIIGTLRSGERISILETRNGWHQIQTASGTGWVSGDFINI